MTASSGDYLGVLRKAFTKHYREHSDEWTRDPAMRVFPALVQGYVKLQETARALDIGCGAGADVDYLSRLFSHVTGVDLYRHEDWAAICSRRPNASFHASPFLEFSARTSFDLVLDNGCLHHQHPDEYIPYLMHIAGLLAPGGWLALSTFKSEARETFIDGNGRRHRYFTETELHGLLAAARFRVMHEDDIYRMAKGDYYRLTYARLSTP